MCKGDVGRLNVGGAGGGGRGGRGARLVLAVRCCAWGAVVAPALVLPFLALLPRLPCCAEVVPVLVLPRWCSVVHLVLLAGGRWRVPAVELLLSRQSFSAAMARTTP